MSRDLLSEILKFQISVLSCNYDLEKQNKACGPNQEYRKCGTACPQTCDGIPENCVQKCVSGCFCKNGFVMDLDRCIPEINCSGNL